MHHGMSITSYNSNMQAIPVQDVSGRNMIFNLSSVIDWQVITAGKQQQAYIYNFRENTR